MLIVPLPVACYLAIRRNLIVASALSFPAHFPAIALVPPVPVLLHADVSAVHVHVLSATCYGCRRLWLTAISGVGVGESEMNGELPP